MKDRESVTMNGKPAFYACIYDDIRSAALHCGWALGLHGSLASDMDIMAMPWTDDAQPVEAMIEALACCFTNSPWKEQHTVPHYGKPNNRVVYTMRIWADFYLDINVIQPRIAALESEVQPVAVKPEQPVKVNKVTYCTQYACLNNTGIERGKIQYGTGGQCKLENPDVNKFENNVWGCGDERYPNETKVDTP